MWLVRITKYVHSCLLVESAERAVLFDPGEYVAAEGVVDLDNLPDIAAVLVTHGHSDHCSTPFIKQLRERFPEVSIVSNQAVVDTLEAEGVKATIEAVPGVTCEQAPHQPLPWRTPAPDNWSVTVFEQLTHPGDSLEITKTAPVLALPVQAPWGSMKEALDMALELQPETIIPIHDWHWHEEARWSLYQKAAEFLQGYGITFHQLDNGQSVEV